MRTLLCAVVACALAWGGVPAVHAQSKPREAKIAPGGVRIGYDGIVPPERWSPLLVTIQPGDEPQALRLTVSYDQDPTQRAVTDAFVTTTPGVPVTVPLLVCPPQGVERISVSLSREGRTLSRAAFARSPQDDEINLLQSLDAGSLMVGTLGQRVPSTLIDKWNAKNSQYNPTGLDRAALVSLRSEDLGQTWAGFDGLNAVIARQSTLDLLPGATLDALALWVTGGGRLVLIADSPGETWRRFAPPGVHASDLRPLDSKDYAALPLAARAGHTDTLNARAVTIDDTGAARGWKGTYPVGSGGGGSNTSFLLAAGPFGGGITVIAAFDPARVSAEVSDAAVLPLWTELLGKALPDRPAGGATDPDQNYSYSYMTSSGDGPAGSAALRSAVDALCDIPPIPSFVYIVIIGLSATLALAVSLGDFIVLGKFKARQRSWLTATLWIAFCGVLAWALPNIVRGGSTTLGRAAVIDVMPAGGGRPVAWRTGVTAVFSATSGNAPFTPASGKGDVGGYWRGVSVLEVYAYYRRSSQPVVNDLPLLQRISALDGAAAAVVPHTRGVPLRQWTLRTMQDFGPVSSAPVVKFVPGGIEGVFAVTGLPAGATFRSGAVHTEAGWSTLGQESAAGGAAQPASGTMRLAAGSPSSSASGWSGRMTKKRNDQTYPGYYDSSESNPADGESYLNLDGPRRRTAAFDALAASGQYAIVHLLIDAPPDVTTAVPHKARGVYAYRIAVPLTESAPPSPSPPAPPSPTGAP